MKKNNFMRIACALLVLTLLSTCVMSGTFAKYVTTGPAATDSARVAEWGVTIEGTGVMFNDSYLNAATTYTANETTNEITVQANTEDVNVVAPGTNGNLAALDVKGTPEVDVQVTYVADLALAQWEVAGDYYCPLTITVNGTDFYGLDYDSAAEFEADVEAAIVAKTARYHTNQDLSAVNDDVVVSWAWAFEGTDGEQTDEKDTALGNAAANPVDNSKAATVALTITATATQID